jgi:hypothetical protein
VADYSIMPRIFRITIRSAHNGKLAWVYAKIPYGGVYNCTEQLTRAMMTGEILWFRIEPAKASAITPHVRAALVRWPEALRSMSERTQVTWLA